MSLGLVVTRMVDHLRAGLPESAASVGTGAPTAPAGVPAVLLSIPDASRVSAGIGDVPGMGNAPGARVRRPIAVHSTIDLADPVLRSPEGDLELLLEGRRVLRLPHGGLVHADGSEPPPPLAAGDLVLRLDGVPLTLVTGAPQPGQFQVDPAAAQALGYADAAASGVVRLGAPASGERIEAEYFLGEYEQAVVRYRGRMSIAVYAPSDAEVDALSDAVGALLQRGALPQQSTAYMLSATSWGAIVAPEPPLTGVRCRTIGVRFDCELADVRLPSGGGVVARVDIQTKLDGGAPPPFPADTDTSVASREETL
jgi:hypothetical protein